MTKIAGLLPNESNFAIVVSSAIDVLSSQMFGKGMDLTFLGNGHLWRRIVMLEDAGLQSWAISVAKKAVTHLETAFRDDEYDQLFIPPTELQRKVDAILVQRQMELSALPVSKIS